MPEAEAQQNRQPHRAALSPTAGRAQSASQPQTPEATIGGVEESWRYEEVPEASLSPSPDPPGSPTPSTQLHPDGGSQGDTARGFQDMMAITCTSLENLRKMLSQSRRGSEDGGGAIHLGNSLDSVVAAMPKLRSIRTAPIDSPPMHEGPADDAEDCSFNLQLRPFANTWDTTSVQPEASPREQLKTSHCTSGFTFSPASKPDRATLLQTWSIGSNRTHSDRCVPVPNR